MEGRKDKFILRWAKRYRAIKELGSKCCRCGEDDMFVLDFHHKDPDEKSYDISSFVKHIDWNQLKIEVGKCILLCRNCHSRLHLEEAIKKFNNNIILIKEKSLNLENISRPKLDENIIYDMLKKKYSLNNIARILNKDVSTIREMSFRLGIKHNEKFHLTREEYNKSKQKINREKLIEMRKKGIPVANIAAHFGCAKSTLYELLRNLKKNHQL